MPVVTLYLILDLLTLELPYSMYKLQGLLHISDLACLPILPSPKVLELYPFHNHLLIQRVMSCYCLLLIDYCFAISVLKVSLQESDGFQLQFMLLLPLGLEAECCDLALSHLKVLSDTDCEELDHEYPYEAGQHVDYATGVSLGNDIAIPDSDKRVYHQPLPVVRVIELRVLPCFRVH